MSFPRYPAYKDSGVEWLGEVPAHWSVLPAKYAIASKSGGQATKNTVSSEPADDLFPAFSASGQDIWMEDYEFDGPALVLSAVGARCGKTFKADGRWGVVANTHCLFPRSGFNRNFLWYITNRESWWERGGTAQPFVKVSETLSRKWVFPPTNEQELITRFLDRETAKIDALVAEQENLIGLLKEKRQAVISHAVTKGLDPSVPMKDSGVEWLGEVPAHWCVCALRRVIATIQQGWSPDCYAREAEDEEWGVLKAGCVNGGTYRQNENKALPPELTPDPANEVHVGDVLMSRASGSPELVGSTALVAATRERLMLSDKIFRLLLAPTIEAPFFVWALNSRALRSQIENTLSGGNGLANNLPQASLLAFMLAVPPLTEQSAIADFLDCVTARIDALVAEAQSAITLLQERRTALISAAVTGQIDARNTKELSGEQSASHIQGGLSLSELDDLFDRTLVEISEKSSDDWSQETDELISKMTPENRANFMDAIENLGRIFKDKNGSS